VWRTRIQQSASGSSEPDQSTGGQDGNSKVPTPRAPRKGPKRRRSSEQDDRREPPHRDGTRRTDAPDRGSAAPSSSAPPANRPQETESRSSRACNKLLQHYRHLGDLAPLSASVG